MRSRLALSLCLSFFSVAAHALDTAIYSSVDPDAASMARAARGGGGTTTTLPGDDKASPLLSSPSPPTPFLLGKYDPCSEPGKATKGRSLYLGIALWPGGTPDAWGPASSVSVPSSNDGEDSSSFDDASLSPCRLSPRTATDGTPLPSAAATLAAAGVVVAPFAVRVDAVAALRVGGSLQRRLLSLAAEAAERARAAGGDEARSSSSPSPVVSAVLFRGTRVRSEARVVSSSDAGLTFGTGFVRALAAEVFIENGALSRIEWPELGCTSCGGRGSRECVQPPPSSSSSSGQQASCSFNSTVCPASSTAPSPPSGSAEDPCGLTVYAGFTGTDRRGVPLLSGAGVRSVGARSALSLLDAIAQRVKSIVQGAAGGGYIGELQGGDGGAA